MTHYRRPWTHLFAVAAVIVACTFIMVAITLNVMNANVWSDLRKYGVEFDGIAVMWMAFCIALLTGAIWWLRRPTIADGSGFPVNRAADPRHTHNPQPSSSAQ